MTLHVYGDVSVQYVFAASLPTSNPSVAPERHLDMLPKWKARPLPEVPVDLFIGIISAGDHFAERMAVRKSWMQHPLVKSSIVVGRFFVALVRGNVDTFLHSRSTNHVRFQFLI